MLGQIDYALVRQGKITQALKQLQPVAPQQLVFARGVRFIIGQHPTAVFQEAKIDHALDQAALVSPEVKGPFPVRFLCR